MIETISKYVSNKYVSFHTPAHMGRNKYINKILNSDYDLTELEETDNLFDESGCIKALEDKLKNKYNAESFFILVNGATSGVMAAINLFGEKDKILIDRNCHISVINALILCGATPVFIETELNEFDIPLPPHINNIKKAYEENPDAKAVFITSPNYYGIVADLKAISQFCREKGLISIADEAHGTHFYYMNEFETAGKYKFDISILSFHKNLPSLTQTGGIIVNNMALRNKLKENLRAFTSTSPSYLFMLSIDLMHRYMLDKGENEMRNLYAYLRKTKNELLNKGIKILNENDSLKFVINCKNADKRALDIKKKYKLVCEMSDSSNITYIISLHNYKKEIVLLKKAILEFLREENTDKNQFSLPEVVLTPKEAVNAKCENISLKNALGRISGEYIINFPPSVPVIVPGEKIDENVLKLIKNRKEIKCVDYVF